MTQPSSATPSDTGAITFADGLPGFEAHHQYVVITSPALDPFTCIRGVGADAPAFLAIDPRRVVEDYRCDLGPSDRRRLDAEAGRPLLWLAIVTPDADGARVNLRAPVVINPETMQGLQVLEADKAYAVDHPLTGL